VVQASFIVIVIAQSPSVRLEEKSKSRATLNPAGFKGDVPLHIASRV
jgi:hypothetical protein